mgnify:CR=1 FL=1
MTKRDYTTVDIRIMRDMVEAGHSISDIAQRLGRTYPAVAKRINTLGFKIRKTRYTPEQCERILECEDNDALAEEMGRTTEMIASKRYRLKKVMKL